MFFNKKYYISISCTTRGKNKIQLYSWFYNPSKPCSLVVRTKHSHINKAEQLKSHKTKVAGCAAHICEKYSCFICHKYSFQGSFYLIFTLLDWNNDDLLSLFPPSLDFLIFLNSRKEGFCFTPCWWLDWHTLVVIVHSLECWYSKQYSINLSCLTFLIHVFLFLISSIVS